MELRGSLIRKSILLFCMTLVFGVLINDSLVYGETISWKPKVTADVNKTWTISFNREIDRNSVTKDTVYVLDEEGERVPLSYEVEGKFVKASPTKSYKSGRDYRFFIVGVRDRGGRILSRDVSMDFTIARLEPLPTEVTNVLPPNRFEYEVELTQKIFDKNQDIRELFGEVMKVDSWVFSFDGELDQAHINMLRPEDAIITPPMEIPLVAILNYHIFMATENLESVRGRYWMEKVYGVARSWENKKQQISESRYMRQAHSGFDLYDASAIEDGKNVLPINIDPYHTWTFTTISPFIDMKNLELTDGTYVVASRKEIVFPLGLFSN